MDESEGRLRSSAVHNFQPVSETTESVRIRNIQISIWVDWKIKGMPKFRRIKMIQKNLADCPKGKERGA
ncbi:MAG: hypothetical protein DRI57_22035 [Deltaproteobacteria bacterium]|nr:MAG: hypothetical protein DRI57_22035 [Deltaproteobacteria bacterium]